MPGPDLSLWKERLNRFLLGGSATIALTLAGAVRTKWLAHTLSASGLGVLAQVFSMQTWLGTACGLGLSAPLASSLAAAEAAGDVARARRILHTAAGLVAIATAVAAILGLLLAEPLSRLLLNTPVHATLVRVAMIAVVGLAAQNLTLGLFASRSDLRAPLTLAIAGGTLSVAVTVLLVPRFGVLGGAVGAAVLFPCGVAVAVAVHRRPYRALLQGWAGIDRGLARSLVSVGGAMLLLAVLDLGVMLALRADYLRRHGTAANGLLQAGLALTQQLGALFYVYLSNYAFGRISGSGGVAAMREYTRRTWGPIALLAAAVFSIAMLVSQPLLHVFFSRRFEAARPMLAWAMVGEYAKVGMQTWMLAALPLRGPRYVVALSIVYPIALAVAYAGFTWSGAGTLSLPWAYAVAGTVALVSSGVGMTAVGVTLAPRQVGIAVLALSGLAWLAATIR